MPRLPVSAAFVASVLAVLACGASPTTGPAVGGEGSAGRAALEFPTSDPAAWINSKPLTLAGLRGQVVLIDVFTYG